MPAIGRSGIKRYSKSNTTKKSNLVKSDEKGIYKVKRDPKKGRLGKKKVYTKLFKTRQPGIEKANTKPQGLSFGETFKKHKSSGDKVFTWKGKKYTTQTKAELEAGKSEKAKFTKKGKSNVEAGKSKKGFFAKVKSALGGDRDMSPAAVERRRMEKRVASMKKRKNQGKSYSAKNLKELEAKLSS